MAKATIQSRSGALITVEGTDEEVSRIIAIYDSSDVPPRNRLAHDRKEQNAEAKEAGRQSASDLILDLKRGGFLDKPRSLGDIVAALEEKGFLYPVTTLSGVVLRLLKHGQLRRKKVEGRWVYGR